MNRDDVGFVVLICIVLVLLLLMIVYLDVLFPLPTPQALMG